MCIGIAPLKFKKIQKNIQETWAQLLALWPGLVNFHHRQKWSSVALGAMAAFGP